MSEIPTKTVPIDSISPHPENYNQHPESQIAELVESADSFGQFKNIVVWSPDSEIDLGNGQKLYPDVSYILCGHGFWLASRRGGRDTIEVKDYTGLPYEDALMLMQVDNAAPLGAQPDPDKLKMLLQKTRERAIDRPKLGAMLARLRESAGVSENGESGRDEPPPQIDKAAELQEKWGTCLGQVWSLGEHRLAVGDCTDKAVVEAVMRGERGRMIFTDPPYGIGKDIENDNLKREAKVEFYRQWTNVALDYIIENAYVYVWGYFDTLSDYWQEVVKPRKDCNFRNFIIWQKTFIQGRNAKEFRQFPEHYEACLLFIFGQPFQNGPWSTSPNAEYYPEMFEPLRSYLDGERQKMGWDIPTVKKMVGHSDLSGDHWFNKSQWSMPTQEVYEVLRKKAGGNAFRREYDDLRREYDDLRGYFDNTNGFTDLWQFDKVTTVDSHPTVKPVEVCERGIMTTSQAGEIVLDCFLGSGTTLIACEQLKRKARTIEIDPAYCAVAIQRWVDLTHQDPVLLSE